MRIAQLTYSTKPRGGVVHTLALAEALADRGHEVTVWTLSRGDDRRFFRPVDPRVAIRIVPLPDQDGEDVGERIERSIQAMSAALDPCAEIVHAQDCISANAAARRGIPVIRTIHHVDAFTTPRLVECHDRAIVDPVARLCVSQAVAGEVESVYGVRPEVILNGVDAERFARAAGPEGAADRDRWTGRLGEYVLALGGIEPRKGSLDLLEGYALARKDHPGLRLVFGGGETLFDYRDYRHRFEVRAAQLGVSPIVLGTIEDGDLPALVAGARALGFVSVKEGFGLAAMEALAARTPVIARDLPVVREVFADSVAYASTPEQIAASISRVIEDRHPADADSGADLAHRHAWSDAARRHEEFYGRVLAERGDDGADHLFPNHR